MDRKTMVKSLSDHFGTQARYLGTPTLAYEVEALGEVYKIDKQGIITTQDGTEVTLEEVIAGLPTKEKNKETHGIEGMEISLPMEGHSGMTLKNIVNMISSKQQLIMKSLEIEEQLMDDKFAEDLSLKNTVTLDDFKAAVEELGKERCNGIAFDYDKNIYTYTFPINKLDYDKITAFAVLAARINESAKEQKRTSYKVSQDDNPKFAFRTWLIRLGMKGSGYKDVRKVLLKNLEGNGAFRKSLNGRLEN